ncbi:MFS transporter [Pseudomonas sp. 5P_3.1_Bac2]|uniref:MFS transporter n=1 Tax=Pseudomonas sp. 5P_3.1_Bac2 TaxID=2971617 RepID=UPI0021C67C40|nr:MFS transporter [Pseudomonas sp. 5P_3.1_Bac2]MCU1717094.1 MFS transporter [Pseudomonas sp. 5P_3.1_Bac2]
MRSLRLGSRGVAILGGIASSIVASLVYPYIVYFLTKEEGFSLTAAGSLVGFATAINVIIRIVAGRLIDSVQLYKLASIGLILVLALPVSLVFYPIWVAVLVGLVAYTAGALLFGASMTLVIYSTDEPETEQKINFSYYYASTNLLLGLAPVAIFFFAVDNYKAVFITAIIFQVASIIVVLLMLARTGSRESSRKTSSAGLLKSYSSLFTKGFAIIFLIGCSYSCVYQQFTSNISVLVKGTQVLGRDLYPLLVAINGLFIVAIQPFYVKVLKKYQAQDVLLPGVVILLISSVFLILPLPVVISFLLFALFFTIAEFIINLGLTDNIISIAPYEARGTWISCFALSRMAGAVGVPLGAILIEDYGVNFYMWSLVLICFVVLILSVLSNKIRNGNRDAAVTVGP